MMIKNNKNSLSILALALTLCLVGCGKDGDPGVGFNEAVKYGNIDVTFSGQRPTDNVTFTSDENFRYYPYGNNPSYYSSVYTNTDTGEKSFYIQRFLSGVDEHVNNNYFSLRLYVSATGEITYYELGAYTTIIDGTKYFGIDEYTSSDQDIVTSEVTNFSYDAATGKLKLNFTWTAPDSNSTEHDLNMTGEVDVIVLEALNNVGDNEG